jgi:hypothetical protein
MPHWKCTECHHEWDSANRFFDVCDWCGACGTTLEIETAFERFLKGRLRVTVEKEDD